MSFYISHDPVKGRGVFTDQDLESGEIIEKCELLLMKFEEVPTSLEGYVYQYNKKLVGLALGNGSLYNHSKKANSTFYFHHRTKTLYIKAKRKIRAHEEITINYGYSSTQKRKFRICD